eukprot:g6176.t1
MSAAARAALNAKKKKAALAAKKRKLELNGEEDDELFGPKIVEEVKPLRKAKNPELHKGWKKDWILRSQKFERFTTGDRFTTFIIVVICLAGTLVGVQMYDGMEEKVWVIVTDNIILGIFTVECLLKMCSEGLEPWRYWTGPEWAWNNFDFVIVVMCYPGISDLFGGGSVALLRLMRLMRIMKLVRQIPQLQMIVMGMIGGFKSIGYIMLLMFLIMYLFGIGGMMAFRENDPWHWGNLGMALNTLFRMATLEDWTDVMYINIYGCHSEYFDSGLYTTNERDADGVGIMYCKTKQGEEPGFGLTVTFMVIYILLSALVVLSLVIGAINMSMSDSLQEMREISQNKNREKSMKKARAALKVQNSENGGKKLSPIQRCCRCYRNCTGGGEDEEGNEKANLLLMAAWKGMGDEKRKRKLSVQHVLKSGEENLIETRKFSYKSLSKKAKWLAQHSRFQHSITITILIAGLMVGIQTYEDLYNNNKFLFDFIDGIILVIFIIEIVVKTIAEYDRPWMYFFVKGKLNKWNTFDFLIVLGSLLPFGGSLVTMLRLLRLLRVLRLLKALPGLQVIVVALVSGLSSISYIGVIMFIFFYVWAIVGMMLFQKNDPWHFGSLHDAMISLFRATTGDDWTDIMYINMLGCEKYGYSGGLEFMCNDPQPDPFFGFLYMAIVIVVGAFVLLPLFIGVVVSGMEEAVDQQKLAAAGARRLKRFSKRFPDCDEEAIELYRHCFHMLDVDGGGSVDIQEFALGLKRANIKVDLDKLRTLMGAAFHDGKYEDEDGGIDFSRFVRIM